jgi:Predicted nucleotidyltransferases
MGWLLNIPNMGITIPNMGMRPHPAGIAESLFTTVQRRVLGILFGAPGRSFQGAELIRLARSGTGAAHRELMRLSASGLITVTRVGSQKFYKANEHSPVFPELHGLIVKTVGLREPIATALRRYRRDIQAAFVFGSFARGKETARSDIDLMIIAKRLEYPELFSALENAEAQLQRKINPHLMTPNDWKRKLEAGNAFVSKVAARPKLFVIGSDDAIR